MSTPSMSSGDSAITSDSRSEEVSALLKAVQDLILPFIDSADQDAKFKHTGHGLQTAGGAPRTALVEHHKPQKLEQIFQINFPKGREDGAGKEGLLDMVKSILKYSVNTWDRGFLDKLYSSTDAVGLVSELLLAALNTNVHVYQVSPALTIVETATARALAGLFGFKGPHAGGISVQGGSASNTTSIVVARNTLYPITKKLGNNANNLKPALFTSEHGHYSISQAAQMLGLGSSSVHAVSVNAAGQMISEALRSSIHQAALEGFTPFYVNVTAGTTVLGSYDPFEAISRICKEFNCWMHIDASWGGPAVFSPRYSYKLRGSHLADSIAINPHKMMGVPLTCSFLLTNDLRRFHEANSLDAQYLFHSADEDDAHVNTSSLPTPANPEKQVYDLASYTLQCGRRGDALKLALGWVYYGTEGYARQIEHAFEMATYLAGLVHEHTNFVLVSENPPPCLQVCFYYAKGGRLSETEENTKATKKIAEALVRAGFMVDYSPGAKGMFFRIVVNRGTSRGVCDGLVKAIERIGAALMAD